MELDRISNLPDVISQKILSGLSLREATRTSVLSRSWRYKSATLQVLEFDFTIFRTPDKTRLVKIVDHVLLLHIGPIHSFRIHLPLESFDLPYHYYIDRWIFCLLRNSVKEMILDLRCYEPPYMIPSCIYSYQELVTIFLHGCVVIPPATFKGFKSLKNLTISWVILSPDGFKLLSCSPLLERLTIRRCFGVTNIKINAPNLQFIDISGVEDVEDVNLDNTSCVTDASVQLIKVVKILDKGSSSNLVKFLKQIPQIRRLSIHGQFLKYLSFGALPEKLCEPPCLYLNILSIRINFNDVNEVSTAVRILLSFPALQKLEIDACRDGRDGPIQSDIIDNYNCKFTQLQLVELKVIHGVKAELDFISFLLSNSPVLERMTVKPTCTYSSTLCKDLLRFRRSSILAEIILLDSAH